MKTAPIYYLLSISLLAVYPALSTTLRDYIPASDTPTSGHLHPASSYEKSISGEVFTELNDDEWVSGTELTRPLSSAWTQHLTVHGGRSFDKNLTDKSLFGAGWHADKEIIPNLYTGAGYSLSYGDLAGHIVKLRGHAPHSLTQSFDGFLIYDDSGRNIFGHVHAQAGFYGLTGWRFDASIGKRWTSIFTAYTDLELSTIVNISTSYWGNDIDGLDDIGIKLAMPIHTSLSSDEKGLKFTPFIQAVWAGNTRRDINRVSNTDIVKSFEVIGGIVVSYGF